MKLEFVEQKVCPLCERQSESKLLYQLEHFGVFDCICGHRFINPALDNKSMMEIYHSSADCQQINPAMAHYYEYETLNPKTQTYSDYSRVLETASRMTPGRDLLEVGCGTGAFLELAKQKGWRPVGVDSSSENIRKVKERGIDGIQTDFNDFFTQKKFDFIALWDLIEHPGNPGALIRKSFQVLKDDGVLFIGTPNYPNFLSVIAESLFRFSGGRIHTPMDKLYFPEHTSYFNRKTLSLLLSREGFMLVKSWNTQTDLDRYYFPEPTKSALRIAFVFARLFRLENRILVFARKSIPQN